MQVLPGSKGRPRAGSLQTPSRPDTAVTLRKEGSRQATVYQQGGERRSLPGGLEGSREKSKSVNRVRSSVGKETQLGQRPGRGESGSRSASEEKNYQRKPTNRIKPSACNSHPVDLNLIRQYREDQQHLQTTINDLVSGRFQLLHGILRSNITDFAPWTAGEAQKGVRFA